MKLMFASDIHGSLSAARAMADRYAAEGCDRLILLGDLLYHGPRNDLPDAYDPKGVIALLNGMKDELLCVRGNCDAEVDQLMFEFPMMSDYSILDAGSETFFLTHGHLWNERILPPIGIGTVLAHGHTHVPELKKLECGLTIFNPGSVSLPKGGSARSFGYFDGNTLLHYCI